MNDGQPLPRPLPEASGRGDTHSEHVALIVLAADGGRKLSSARILLSGTLQPFAE